MQQKDLFKLGSYRSRLIHQLFVAGLRQGSHRGFLVAGSVSIPCAIGRNGLSHRKREGDGATPAGTFWLLQGYFRSDRLPRTALAPSVRPIRLDDGWCDDPASGLYNCRVKLPFKSNHESLARDDSAYDILFTLDHNRRPRCKGRGSTIFFHLAHTGLTGTAGCISIQLADMRRLLPRLSKKCRLRTG